MALDIKRFIFLPGHRIQFPICPPSASCMFIYFTGTKRSEKDGKAKIIKIKIEPGGYAGHAD